MSGFPPPPPGVPEAAWQAARAAGGALGLRGLTIGGVLGRTGRRPGAATFRVHGHSSSHGPVSIKLLPPAWPFDAAAAMGVQSGWAGTCAVPAPRLLGHAPHGGWVAIVEEQLVAPVTLAELVATGAATPEEGRRIIGQVAAAMLDPAPPAAPTTADLRALQGALAAAPLPADQRRRIASWLASNYTTLAQPPVAMQGDLAPDNLVRPAGDHRWWIVDFDLAGVTSLPWWQITRVAKMTGWGIPYWRPEWPAPDSLAVGLVTSLLEWDLQRKVSDDAKTVHEHLAAALTAAATWAQSLGPPHRAAAATLPVAHGTEESCQVFWARAGAATFSEADSLRAHWPADGLEHCVELPLPAGEAGAVRLDPAEGICICRILEVAVRVAGTWEPIDAAAIAVGGDAKRLAAREGEALTLAVTGPDPQLAISSLPGGVDAFSLRGVKHPGVLGEAVDAPGGGEALLRSEMEALVEATASAAGKALVERRHALSQERAGLEESLAEALAGLHAAQQRQAGLTTELGALRESATAAAQHASVRLADLEAEVARARAASALLAQELAAARERAAAKEASLLETQVAAATASELRLSAAAHAATARETALLEAHNAAVAAGELRFSTATSAAAAREAALSQRLADREGQLAKTSSRLEDALRHIQAINGYYTRRTSWRLAEPFRRLLAMILGRRMHTPPPLTGVHQQDGSAD